MSALKNSNQETVELDNTPYCSDCGSEDLAYLDQYANGEYWRCKECGKEFIYKLDEE